MKKSKKVLIMILFRFTLIIFTFLIYSCGSEKNNSGEINIGTPVTNTRPFKNQYKRLY